MSQLTLAAGNKQAFEAVGYYSDGSSHALTDLSVSDWHTSDQDVGYFNDPGVLIGGDTPGIVTVYASKDGITSNVVSVTVTDAVITAIQVTPSPVVVPKGEYQALQAIATYSDGSSANVTRVVTWTPTDTAVAVVTDGVLRGVGVGDTELTASRGDITSDTVAVTVTDAVITAIQVTPSPVVVPKGEYQALQAIATYSDGSSANVTSVVTWTPTDTAVAVVTDGVLRGVGVGDTELTASRGDITSDTVAVTVTDAVITAIQVTPSPVVVPKGEYQALQAIATYSDGSSANVTRVVTWTSADTAVAVVTPDGFLSGVEVGSTTVTATKDGITSNVVAVTVTDAVITAIQVTPSPVVVPKGEYQALQAIATYSDGSSANVTRVVTWTSADTAVAVVTPDGFLSGVEVGSTTVTATKDGITSNVVAVTVTDAVITAIQVTPLPVVVPKGEYQALQAIATYSDGSSANVTSVVTWTSADTAVAVVTPDGFLSGVEVGSTTVTATKDGITSNVVAVTVTDAVITAIQVTPATVNVAKGQTAQLVATATYSDTTSSDVTSSVAWTVGATATATVSPAGLLSGVEVGSTTVTATKDGITSNVVAVTVTDAVITAIQVTPSPVVVPKGEYQALQAIATYSDGSSANVTSVVTWTPTDTAVAVVTPDGFLSGVEVGSTTVTATKDGITSNVVAVTVTDAVITAIQVTPSPVVVPKGEYQALQAIATYSDGSSANVTRVVTWTSADTAVAVVTPDGFLSGVEVGSTTVTATKDGITSNVVAVTVTDAVITAIQVTPLPVVVPKGEYQALQAIATYSDGSSANVTRVVTWTSADTAVAVVTPDGFLSGVEVGSTTVTATKDGITSNVVAVTVTDAVITAIQVTPATVNVAKGQTAQLVATATYSDTTSSDVTSSVAWTVGATATATVSPAGLLSGVEVGSTTVTATKDGITSNVVAVTVTDAVITAIQVTPSPVVVPKGEYQALQAIATYSDGSSANVTSVVTWTPTDTAVAVVTPDGFLSGVEVGSTTVTATKDGITSNVVAVTVTADAVITAIQVTPSPVVVPKGEYQALQAIATYSDGSSANVTRVVTWTSADTAVAVVTPDGFLSGVEVGSTTVTATKDVITSNTVNVTVCSSLAGACIDIFDTGGGKLFTSSPSVAYLDSIDGSATNNTNTENGTYGPAGNFYLFDWTNAKTLCNTYNTLHLGERTNWRLATKDELKKELFGTYNNMFSARGWPANTYYWSVTPDGSGYYGVDLSNGYVSSNGPGDTYYASCVSNP
ncbi:Ig-like domain-containing protein [Shewanella baltica]|uniref:Ig-like domain-containing protein n=1 Tax=Shewanella baltica TaxID=62322 RepID=UPI0038732046